MVSKLLYILKTIGWWPDKTARWISIFQWRWTSNERLPRRSGEFCAPNEIGKIVYSVRVRPGKRNARLFIWHFFLLFSRNGISHILRLIFKSGQRPWLLRSYDEALIYRGLSFINIPSSNMKLRHKWLCIVIYVAFFIIIILVLRTIIFETGDKKFRAILRSRSTKRYLLRLIIWFYSVTLDPLHGARGRKLCANATVLKFRCISSHIYGYGR